MLLLGCDAGDFGCCVSGDADGLGVEDVGAGISGEGNEKQQQDHPKREIRKQSRARQK